MSLINLVYFCPFICVCTSVSVYIPFLVSPSVCLSVYQFLPVGLCFSISVYVSSHLCVHLPLSFLSIHMSTLLCTYISAGLSAPRFVCVTNFSSIYLSTIFPSVYVSISACPFCLCVFFLSTNLLMCLSTYSCFSFLSTSLSYCVPICLSVSLCIGIACLFVYRPIYECLPICLWFFFCLFTNLIVYVSVRLSLCLIYLSVSLSYLPDYLSI